MANQHSTVHVCKDTQTHNTQCDQGSPMLIQYICVPTETTDECKFQKEVKLQYQNKHKYSEWMIFSKNLILLHNPHVLHSTLQYIYTNIRIVMHMEIFLRKLFV